MTLNESYWQRITERAGKLGSDGCTGVPEWRKHCCIEHDMHYRTGMTITGVAINRQEADAVFWECNRRASPFSFYSPFALWRWAGVRIWARRRIER